MADLHPLDFPIWTALATRQAPLAEGGALARRFPLDIAPFAALRDGSAESWAALRALLGPGEQSAFFTPEALSPPDDFTVLMATTGEQMVGMTAEISGPALVRLGDADVPQMMALVELTKPGPFAARTHTLGNFFGIKIEGRLVAMTGERMKPANWTEMTAVCVHPDFRGRGYAQVLLSAVARQIAARGETPFLHVFSDNTGAIALYKRQGMTIRRRIHVTVLAKRG